MPPLNEKKCLPCEGGVSKLRQDEVDRLLPQIPGWLHRDGKICRQFRFKTFMGAIGFIRRMAEVAESEGHHPDFCVHFRDVDVTVYTHAIDGLSENDFILAAKIDALL